MMARGRAPTFATIAVVVASFVSPRSSPPVPLSAMRRGGTPVSIPLPEHPRPDFQRDLWQNLNGDRKSTRLNSSHLVISYAVFCLKKKKNKESDPSRTSYHSL